MKLSNLVRCSRQVARRGKRLDKIETLRELLVGVEGERLGAAVTMLAGEIPGGKLGVGAATLRVATDAPEESKGPGPDGAELTLSTTLNTFDAIRNQSGAGSKQRRIDELRALFGAASADEHDFLLRLLSGELRQGALAGLMIEALSQAADVPATLIRRAVMLSGDLAAVAEAALMPDVDKSSRIEALAAFRVELFRPLQPMLASAIESVDAAGERIALERLAVEVKMDGARVQVHRDGEDVRVYSRQLNDVTHSVPEVVEVARSAAVRRFIADGEVYAIGDEGKILPFQTTMRRFSRSRNIDAQAKALPLEVRFFDLLLLGDDELIDQPLHQRWAQLETLFPQHQAERYEPKTLEEARQRFAQVLKAGHEGLMIKHLDSSYEAGSRGFSWLKLKQVHTLDLVVLAVERGSGRRSGWLSNLHLGARDEGTDTFVMLGKTFKGLTDAMLRWQTEHLAALECDVEDGYVHHVRPELVVEIAFNNIQESSQYPAGMALRFARVKAHRPDKDAASASTLREVRELFVQEHGHEPKL